MLNDKVVLITGAGSGLGRALVHVFADSGARVVGVGRTMSALQETGKELASDIYFPMVADVSDYSQVVALVGEIYQQVGKIDIVFNNAAVYPKVNFLDETAAEWDAAVAINLNGVANVCKAVLPKMLESDTGKIFNVGSWAHLGPIADSAAYSCTKGAIHSLTKAIAVDIAAKGKNVEVHEWIPGHLNTQMSEYTGMQPDVAAGWALSLASIQNTPPRSCIYEQNFEWQPPKGLKQKVKDKVLFWKK